MSSSSALTISARFLGPSARKRRTLVAAALASRAVRLNPRCHVVRRASRTAAEKRQKSAFDAMWIVDRIIQACTTVLRSSARVRSSRRNPSSRVQSPRYPAGAYCVWSPHTRSNVRGIVPVPRSSSDWRASSARFSSRSVRVRGGSAAGLIRPGA
jgi:hypothetical protein